MTPQPSKTDRNGKIVTFYSYKGGTGRSMALANVAWVLASCGYRVLAVDWDLEAPGLHRYFDPFLSDKALKRSTGVIDFILDFATAAVSGQSGAGDVSWYEPYSNLLAHATSIEWTFPQDGILDLVPAGRQDPSYANRVNAFNWQSFYEKLGGGILLESVKQKLRKLYDFILIDSRTGVSDTSGICTVQMPDELVVCFTLNRQSIYGAAAAARSAYQQRRAADGVSTLKIWPVPMRLESAEKERLDFTQAIARTVFAELLQHLEPDKSDIYWGEIGVPYEAYYAYEEVLAVFKDRPRQTNSILSKMQMLAQYLGGTRSFPVTASDEVRNQGLSAFAIKSAWEYVDELGLLAEEYERIRRRMKAGVSRTGEMNVLFERAQLLSGKRDAGEVAQELFGRNTDGSRVVGLALARSKPERRHVDMGIQGIAQSRSAFEQYHALLLTESLMRLLDPSALQQIRSVVKSQINKTISQDDPSRWSVAEVILGQLEKSPVNSVWQRSGKITEARLGEQTIALNECRPSTSFVRYEDVEESHGQFVITRGIHQLRLSPVFRISKHLVTNRLYMEFMKAGGYLDQRFWTVPSGFVVNQFTAIDQSNGPRSWPRATSWPEGKAEHPVSGISFHEAQAFVCWCNESKTLDGGWSWCLPSEDLWEFAARGEAGLIYPWGDAFDVTKCNSAESGFADTTDVTHFESGASIFGCCDMAGNVWEFVDAADSGPDWCILRGGSYENNHTEVRSYLRLFDVPRGHRPPDFGFRLAQIQMDPNESLAR